MRSSSYIALIVGSGVTVSKAKNRQEYLEEHLYYEVQMIFYAFRKMNKENSQLEWNTAFSAFAVHARNLVDFLTNVSDARNFRASDFTSDYKSPEKAGIKGTMNRLHRDVFHLGKLRPREAMRKINTERVRKLHEWIANAIPIFEAKLTPESRKYWKPGLAAIPVKESVSLGPIPNRTSTVVTSAATFVVPSLKDRR